MSNTNTKPDWSKAIRAHIAPFGNMPAEKQTQRFMVGWHDKALLFTDIMEAIRETIVRELVYFRKVARQHIPDLLQQGWLRLWQDLQNNSELFAQSSRLKAADYVSNRCGSSTVQYYLKRYTSYHQFSQWNKPDSENFEESITEIVIGSSLKSIGRGRHALFTRKVDIHLDIADAIRQVADWCGDNLKKLAALYFITTSVEQVDAGRIAGLTVEYREERKPRCPALQYWIRKVTNYLQSVLDSYRPIEPNKQDWRKCLKAGNVQPIIQLAKKYTDDETKLTALYSLTTCVSCSVLVKELGVCEYKLKYAMEQLRQELRCLYAARIPT